MPNSTPPARKEKSAMVEVKGIRLYLPEAEMQRRLDTSIEAFAQYIQALEKETTAHTEASGAPEAKGLLIAVGVKPGNKSRVWCEAVDGQIPPDILQKLESRLSAVPAIELKSGPVAFAIEIQFAGQKVEKFPVAPKVWLDASKNNRALTIPDNLFKAIWPE